MEVLIAILFVAVICLGVALLMVGTRIKEIHHAIEDVCINVGNMSYAQRTLIRTLFNHQDEINELKQKHKEV
jgi:hypothetical protein